MLGINTTLYKVVAYALSAVFAALAGGITAYQNIHVTPGRLLQDRLHAPDDHRDDHRRRRARSSAPCSARRVYQLLSTYVWGRFIELHPTVLGLIIVLFIVFLPRGLMTVLARKRQRRRAAVPGVGSPRERARPPGDVMSAVPKLPRRASPASSILEARRASRRSSAGSRPWTASTSRSGSGEILGVIGPNGAGKTTFVNCMTGLDKPTSGTIVFDGQDITKTPSYRIGRLGMARTFQVVKPLRQLTVRENVATGAMFGARGKGRSAAAGARLRRRGSRARRPRGHAGPHGHGADDPRPQAPRARQGARDGPAAPLPRRGHGGPQPGRDREGDGAHPLDQPERRHDLRDRARHEGDHGDLGPARRPALRPQDRRGASGGDRREPGRHRGLSRRALRAARAEAGGVDDRPRRAGHVPEGPARPGGRRAPRGEGPLLRLRRGPDPAGTSPSR